MKDDQRLHLVYTTPDKQIDQVDTYSTRLVDPSIVPIFSPKKIKKNTDRN